MKVMISRLYNDVTQAQAAIERLRQAGVDDDDLSLIANNSEKWFAPDLAGAAGTGAAVGAGFGGVGGLLAGLGLLAVPGLGPMVAAGWLAATLAGAAAVGAAGGIVGMLAEAGVATNEAEIYAESIRRGGSLVGARVAAKDKARLEALLDPSSVNLAARRGELEAGGWTAFDPAGRDYSGAEVAQERVRQGASSGRG